MQRPAKLRQLLSRAADGTDPAERLSALAQLRRELETAETELAAEALGDGMSWSQIGAALGISKQAAHRRHSRAVAALSGRRRSKLRTGRGHAISEQTQRAVRIARSEAAAMGNRVVGTEHLLLGLLQSGDARTTGLLKRAGVTLPLARRVALAAADPAPAAGENDRT
jgi:ATP-dependent Clp protease ATP-binding subunit ClpA